MLTRSATAAARAAAHTLLPVLPPDAPAASSRRGICKSQAALPTAAVNRHKPDPSEPASVAHLPPEILALIFEHVGTASIGQLLLYRGVNRQFRGVIEGQALNALYRRVLASWGAPTTVNPRARKLKALYALVYHYFTEHCARCPTHFAADKLEPYAPRIWPFQILCRDCRANRCLRVIRGGDKRTLRRLPTREILGRNEDKRMCKSTLIKLGLPAKIIAQMPCELVENPHHSGAAPMRLYDPRHVRAVLFAWTGSREPIDPFQSRHGPGRGS
ncbi:hypothetical protein GGF31_000225 [Allomyces arbusculus]|nr:hypothetical protein GGF31_000225 [Allomyces arbusculus]